MSSNESKTNEPNHDSRDEMISNFCAITGVEPSRGQFYLESTNWNLNLSIESFFEHSDEPSMSENTNTTQTGIPSLAQSLETQPIVNRSDSDSSNSDNTSPAIHKRVVKAKKEPKRAVSNFATLDSLKNNRDSGESSEEEGQAFYAGGSEHSGQQVLGPKKKNTNELVTNMFKSAKEHGAEVVDQTHEQKRNKNINSFVGMGFRLGSTPEQSTPVNTTIPSSTSKKEEKEIVLKLWKNGFSVDEGEVRAYDDPQNREFLASIHKGEIPRELVKEANGQEVHLNMEDHRSEDFTAPKKPLQAFTGEGFRLGTPVAGLVSNQTTNSDDKQRFEEEAQKRLNADPNQPMTRIQIRLSDGSILVVKINLSFKISDLREYICNARPVYSSTPFVLMTTFPNRELTDESLTIKDANLANASIVQRLK